MKVHIPALAAALTVLASAPVAAQGMGGFVERYRPPPRGVSDTYIVTLSGTAAFEPRFPGAERQSLNIFPALAYRRSDEPARFTAPDDGAAIPFVDDPTIRFGPVFRYQSGRYLTDQRPQLFGLRKLDWDIESGLFLEYWPLTFLRARIEARQGFRQNSGLVGNAGIDLVLPYDRFVFSIGPRMAFGNQVYLARYFGVNAFEASLNPLVYPYRPQADVFSAGALATIGYRWNETWSTTVFGGYSRLLGEAADSPIPRNIGSRDQWTAGLRVSYSFAYTPSQGIGGLGFLP